MDGQRKPWTPEQVAAANKRRDQDVSNKSAQGAAHGDGGTDMPQAGDPCTTSDGRSGYIFAGGDELVCKVDGEG